LLIKSEVEVAHLSFDAARDTLAATGDGVAGSDLQEDAIKPVVTVFRGERLRKREDGA
jgi:hypothetical protein